MHIYFYLVYIYFAMKKWLQWLQWTQSSHSAALRVVTVCYSMVTGGYGRTDFGLFSITLCGTASERSDSEGQFRIMHRGERVHLMSGLFLCLCLLRTLFVILKPSQFVRIDNQTHTADRTAVGDNAL